GQWGDPRQLTATPLITVEELQARQGDFWILDVRTPAEWQQGHISGAHLCELTVLEKTLDAIPHSQPIAVVCHSGNRSSVAASLLNQKGWRASNVKGGMQAWNNRSLA